MPSESRFDDLDLREEPVSGRAESDIYTGPCTQISHNCTQTQKCTLGCCNNTDLC